MQLLCHAILSIVVTGTEHTSTQTVSQQLNLYVNQAHTDVILKRGAGQAKGKRKGSMATYPIMTFIGIALEAEGNSGSHPPKDFFNLS